jgi:chorismate mutase
VNPDDDPVLARHRDEVNALDGEIFRLVHDRVEAVRRLKRHKDAQGYAFLDPGREERMVAEQVAANEGSLSADAVRRLYAELLALTKRELDAG